MNAPTIILLNAAALLLCGCASISGRLPQAAAPQPTGHMQAGAAQMDITPPPGYPTGGFSIAGTTSRGYWTRLRAKSLYFEDAQGHGLVLASCDLWSIPGGLADRVAQQVMAAPEGRHLSRGSIVLAATHTHHSPANFSTCPAYNQLASREGGFDERLFNFLAARISSAILASVCAKQPAVLHYREQLLPGFFRNRSYEAFLLDPEAGPLLKANEHLPLAQPTTEFPSPEASRAVYPMVGVLRAETQAQPRAIIAAAAFLAVHPITLPGGTELYQSDIFGVAATLVEQQWRRPAPGYAPALTNAVLAIFNGAEGDVSPMCRSQDRPESLRLGTRLAAHLGSLLTEGELVEGPIQSRATNCPIANRAFCDEANQPRHTADVALPGAAVLGGAEDSRPFLWDLGWKEGVRGPRDPKEPYQGAKQPAFDPRIKLLPVPIHLTRLVSKILRAPQEAELSVHAIGPLVLATLPGEFTTVMGRRIAAGLTAAAPRRPAHVLLIGLANEYLSYFATPEEYDAQHYEGASTLYGPASGPLIQHALTELAKNLETPQPPEPTRQFRYRPGATRHFSPRDLGPRPYFEDDGLGKLVEPPGAPYACRNFPRLSWQEPARPFPPPHLGAPVWPTVIIEAQQPDGKWAPLEISGVPETDAGLDLVTLVLEATPKQVSWSALWLAPDGLDPHLPCRFCVRGVDQVTRWSAPFTLEQLAR